jgi:hypothetical protein
MRTWIERFAVCAIGCILLSGTALAGEKKLMHCFAFTVIDEATDADWKAFAAATDALPGKIPGLTKVWHGKLARPLTIYNAKGEKSLRQHGVCMEMENQAALAKYASNPAHAEWMAVYEKVRKAGTTTYDILGE